MSMMHAVAVSSCLPRPCGIATFNDDIVRILDEQGVDVQTVAVDNGKGYQYPPATIAVLDATDRAAYSRLAHQLNALAPDVILLQHEFGLFGGVEGSFILDFLRALTVPVVTFIHTYPFSDPDSETTQTFLGLLEKIGRLSNVVITISSLAQRRYQRQLRSAGVQTPVLHLPHGTPDVRQFTLAQPKRSLGLEGRKVLTTFGLISPSKGIDDVLAAMPAIREQHPEIVFRILGRTHPANVEARQYLHHLHELVEANGLTGIVEFVSKFLSVREIMEQLQATDIYITPYRNASQASSGTLAYAVAAGCCVVSTPYVHARELLGDGRGVIVPFNRPDMVAQTVNFLLKHDRQRQRFQRRAYLYGRSTGWETIGRQLVTVLRRLAVPEAKPVLEPLSAVQPSLLVE